MKRNNKLISTLISAVVVFLGLSIVQSGVNSQVQAYEVTKIDSKTKERIYRDLNGHVSKENIESLIMKINKGEKTKANLTTAIPIVEKKFKGINYTSVLKIYDDYSYTLSGFSKLPGNSFRELSGISCGGSYCYASNGHAYKYINGGELGFYASFEYASGEYGDISSVWSGYAKGGSVVSGPYISHKEGVFYASEAGYIYDQHVTVTLSVSKGGAYVY